MRCGADAARQYREQHQSAHLHPRRQKGSSTQLVRFNPRTRAARTGLIGEALYPWGLRHFFGLWGKCL